MSDFYGLCCPFCQKAHRYIDCENYQQRPKAKFIREWNCPLFIAIRSRTDSEESRVKRLQKDIEDYGRFFTRFDRFDAITAVCKRIVRDRPMHILKYQKVVHAFASRYGICREVSLTSRGLLLQYGAGIGFVSFDGRAIKFFGEEFRGTQKYGVLREIERLRDIELERKKCKDFSDDEIFIHAALFEAKEILKNGKARIFRQKNFRSA